MLNIFGHFVRTNSLLIGLAEFALISTACYLINVVVFGIDSENVTERTILNLALLPAALIMVPMFSLGLYESKARHHLKTFLVRLLFASLLGTALIYVTYWFVGLQITEVSAIAIASGSAAFAIILSLWFLYRTLSLHELFQRRVLILGDGERAKAVKKLCEAEEAAVLVQGMVPESDIKSNGNGSKYNLFDTCMASKTNEIVVALQERRGVMPTRDLLACRMHGVLVSDYSSFFERESGKVDLDNVYPSWLVFSDGFRANAHTLFVKRLFDIAISLIILVVCAPVLIIAWIVIRLDSPGGAIYRQIRVGIDSQNFEVLKFRSMRQDAEKDGKAQWAKENDDRVTRVGQFIRRTRIDELPQLFNVLRGDMSFVGPRPERPEFVERLAKEIPYYSDRHRVKPGITGWAQINYPYGATDEDAKEKLKYDLFYMKNCTLFLDAVIILKTVRVVLWPEGVR